MYTTTLMAGQRILVTGGGTGLGQAMAERFLALGADVAICGRRKAVCDETAAAWRAQLSRAPHRHLRRRHPQRAGGRGDGRGAVADAAASPGLVNNAAGNFIAPTESLSPRAFDAIANIVFHGTFYVTQAVGKRWVAEAQARAQWTARAAVSQRHEHHRDLGRQRLALRRAVGDEQGRHRGDDQVARGGVGALRHAAQRGRPRRDPDRGHEQAAQPRRGARRAQPRAQPDGAHRAG